MTGYKTKTSKQNYLFGQQIIREVLGNAEDTDVISVNLSDKNKTFISFREPSCLAEVTGRNAGTAPYTILVGNEVANLALVSKLSGVSASLSKDNDCVKEIFFPMGISSAKDRATLKSAVEGVIRPPHSALQL